MAVALWGKVYNNSFAGELRQEPGGRCVFTYDSTYIQSKGAPIAYTLAVRAEPHICEPGLHPFFDNLVAEGWLRNAQARALRVDTSNRFALLLAFGHDTAGAVSIVDPAPVQEPVIDLDSVTAAALSSRASISGIQRKLLAVQEGKRFRPAKREETSTYIAKFSSGTLTDIVENEYLTTISNKALLPDHDIVDVQVGVLDGIQEKAVLVKRFDRLSSGKKRHFEEFNQLMGRRSGDDKYEAAYEDIASFLRGVPGHTAVDLLRLFERILVCFLTGNTDAHLKNFAMFHTADGLRLTPAYDLVAAALYPEYQTLALAVGNAANLGIANLKPKHFLSLGEAYGLDAKQVLRVVSALDSRRAAAAKAVLRAAKRIEAETLGQNLVELMEKRWNGSFASTGQYLSKKQSGDDGN